MWRKGVRGADGVLARWHNRSIFCCRFLSGLTAWCVRHRHRQCVFRFLLVSGNDCPLLLLQKMKHMINWTEVIWPTAWPQENWINEEILWEERQLFNHMVIVWLPSSFVGREQNDENPIASSHCTDCTDWIAEFYDEECDCIFFVFFFFPQCTIGRWMRWWSGSSPMWSCRNTRMHFARWLLMEVPCPGKWHHDLYEDLVTNYFT